MASTYRFANRHRRDFVRIDVDHPALALASDGAALFDFDFSDRDHDTVGTVTVTANGGRVDGIVQWVWLQLDEAISYENRPDAERPSHWQALFWPVERRQLARGTRIEIRGWRHESS